LKTYAENAKVNGFVVGISGGVDSANFNFALKQD
jgi:NAD+ synthase